MLTFGCQSMPHEQEPTVLVENQPGIAEKFVSKAVKFFQTSISETKSIASSEKPMPFFAAKPPSLPTSKSSSGTSSSAVLDQTAFQVPVRSKSLIHASQMLFHFDPAENEPPKSTNSIASSETENNLNSELSSGETGGTTNAVAITPPSLKSSKRSASSKTNVLQAQDSDSESFRQLLQLIAKTPKEDRGVDDVKLEQLLTQFRNSTWEEVPGLEANCLLLLRNKILPNDQAAQKRTKLLVDTKENIEADEDVDNEEKDETTIPAPLPPLKSSIAKRASVKNSLTSRNSSDPKEQDEQNRQEQNVAETKNSESKKIPLSAFPQHLTQSKPQSTPQPMPQPPTSLPTSASPSVYPALTQLEGSQPIIPASYHPQYGNQFKGSDGNVVHADYTTSPRSNHFGDKDWELLVRQGADQLRYKIEQTPGGRTFANEGRLRLLEMILDNRNEAVKPISGAEKPVNEFMSNQMLGFAAFLDEIGTPDARVRNVSALFRFDESLAELRKICPIKLKKVQIVKEWDAFGCFIPRQEDCHAGEKIELYVELENSTVRRTQQGFNVSLSISYEIRDMSAKILQKIDHLNAQETTPSQKRDYCVGFRVQLPENMPPGQYQLRISVTDLNDEAMQYSEEQIPFKVVPIVSPEN
jgi:hypothetical protein